MKHIITTLMVIFYSCQPALATTDPHPPVTEDTLIGTWEAISERSLRVFRLEIRKKGASFLAYAVPNGMSWVLELSKKEIRDGRVFLEFKDHKNKVIHIIGDGVAGRDGPHNEGIINAELIMNPNDKPLNIWTLKFIKAPYVEKLFDLSLSAKEAIKRIENKK